MCNVAFCWHEKTLLQRLYRLETENDGKFNYTRCFRESAEAIEELSLLCFRGDLCAAADDPKTMQRLIPRAVS